RSRAAPSAPAAVLRQASRSERSAPDDDSAPRPGARVGPAMPSADADNGSTVAPPPATGPPAPPAGRRPRGLLRLRDGGARQPTAGPLVADPAAAAAPGHGGDGAGREPAAARIMRRAIGTRGRAPDDQAIGDAGRPAAAES